jgi:hypothetical protein
MSKRDCEWGINQKMPTEKLSVTTQIDTTQDGAATTVTVVAANFRISKPQRRSRATRPRSRPDSMRGVSEVKRGLRMTVSELIGDFQRTEAFRL